ncbi:formate--tetrahydrofolate ligase [Chelatococcus sambhunathii]|uniref:Formate--tetrahydrofolate ligase n=1 Tax=Chelatococcus sambhunathii TaxID=363953 RepID=A0ABU1DDV0_9HYPH|nr:formate--tetrahydrofolate ligase [Chelatococcus sambhunathii]MDR4306262.1 formate--tetrahydrofolate ligase [Chelatococcus sambhunathii]
MPTDIEIARAATLKPIAEIAAKIGVPEDALHLHGKHIAKVDDRFIAELPKKPDAKLVLVTAISPTPAGEGKTTTTVGLGDALNLIGEKAVMCLREPSLGPVFGVKGGAAGGGKAQVIPMEQINLHFTGDFHAITSANNLLAALVDNSLYWGNPLNIDPRRIVFRRVLDMNDRTLRSIISGVGAPTNGYTREAGFDITVASEIMAIFCLAKDLKDLEERIGRIVVAYTPDRKPITAKDVDAQGSLGVLLRDALRPNIVQSIEGSPVFIHGGPFANIAHGCNSVIATTTGLKLADWTVTEAGFGADLGAEKFMDIKCRYAGLAPDVVVIVATVRALKMHGGMAKNDLKNENVEALKAGLVNLGRHIENVKKFGVPAVVAINHFVADTDAEIEALQKACREDFGVEAVICKHWADGAKGAEALARTVVKTAGEQKADFKVLYPDEMPLFEKVETIAKELYRADKVQASAAIRKQLKEWEDAGYGKFPVCIAKTQNSFSADPTAYGAPTGHILPIREVRLSAGAGFIVVVCGEIMTMPGLPKTPASANIRLLEDGTIDGIA